MMDNFHPLVENELSRPRIDQLLEKAIQCPVVIIVAGAGYGKSRAVGSFLRKNNFPTAWMQFSEYDNLSEHFWEKYTEALSVFGKEASASLKEFGFPQGERNIERYFSRTPVIPGEKYVFVYDDFHLLQNEEVLQFLERSISNPLPNSTSIIISRNEPALNLGNIQAQAGRITEEMLRFTMEETAEFLQIVGRQPSPKTVRSVYDDTEGWAFAIQLAGLALKNTRTGDVHVPHALRSNIFKLLENEIIEGLPGELRKFFIKLSLIDNHVPELLSKIADNEEQDHSLVDQMEQACTFIRYDPYLNSYRIHTLFLDFLRAKQDELSLREKNEVWEKAAAWCLQNNHWIDAIRYYEKAGDYTGLIHAVETFPSIIPKQTAGFLLDVLGHAPEELFFDMPSLRIARVHVLLALEMFDRADDELWAIVKKLEGQKAMSGDEQRLLAACYGNLGFLGSCICVYTHDYSYVKFFEKAHAMSLLFEYKPEPPINVMYLPSYLCRACEAEEIENFNRAFIETANYLTSYMNGCGYGGEELILAESAFFKGDISSAEELSQKALAKARQKNQYEIENRALFFLLRLYLHRGDCRLIPKLLSQVEALLDMRWYNNRYIYHDLFTGWFYVQTGQSEKIAGWLKNDFEKNELYPMLTPFENLLKAKFYFAQKRYPATLAILGKGGQGKYTGGTSLLGTLERELLEAVCRYRLDDREGAFQKLEKAWELAVASGFWMPFAELGKDMRALAAAALKAGSTKIPHSDLEKIRSSAAVYAKKLFAVSDQYSYSANAGKEKAGLSDREKSVLVGLSQGLTREEIAKASSISINTVKSAIRNLYHKLGAVNRANAIRIAAERGIL